MFTVTEAAGAHLAQLLQQQSMPEETAVRFVCQGQGIALQPDSEREGDTKFEHEGRTVLLLDAQVAELLAEDTLEFQDGKLALLHPREGE